MLTELNSFHTLAYNCEGQDTEEQMKSRIIQRKRRRRENENKTENKKDKREETGK
jgi:hypothetical protein